MEQRESRKGLPCLFKGIICVEGTCNTCRIKEQVESGEIVLEIAEKENRREKK